MNDEIVSAQADLAFMRGVVEGGRRAPMVGGVLLLTGGLLYGLQCLIDWADMIGRLALERREFLVVNVAPTVLLLLALIGVLAHRRRDASGGGVPHAVNAAFAAGGLANLAMIVVFGVQAWRRQDLTVWELYPAVVFALQGAAWFVAFRLRRQAWLILVSLGWLVAAAALGLLVGTRAYVLTAGLSLLFLMALPGAVVLRQQRRAA